MPWFRSVLFLFIAASLLSIVSGCQSPGAGHAALSSSNPLDRAHAAVRLAESGDATAVHKLVELLEDGDRGVRLFTILALQRLCGDDFGYRYHAADADRSDAVRRWREALREGRVAIRKPVPAACEPRRPTAVEAAVNGSASEEGSGKNVQVQ